jgi:hypothetical protein
VLKFHSKYERIIIELAFFLKRRNLILLLVTNTLTIVATCSMHSILIHSKRFLYPLLLVTIIASGHCVFLFALNLSPLKLELVIADHLPVINSTLFALEHHTLEQLSLAVAKATCHSGLCEVHNHEFVVHLSFGVPHTEIKPLLMTFGIGIYLHIEPVLSTRDSVCP